MKDDLEELKAFVVDHPNNKMAWYFLGRAYAARGEDGKALYCFRQSGEIYHIYEQKELLPSEDDESVASSEDFISLSEWEGNKPIRRTRTSVWTWSWPKTVLCLVLILLISLQAPGSWPLAPGYEAQEQIEPIAPIDEKAKQGEPGENEWTIGIPAHSDGWVLWGKEPSWQIPKTQSEASSDASWQQVNLSWNGWRMKQEELWVMHAGLTQYKLRQGTHVENVEQLTQSYPDNVLSGLTEEMRSAYTDAVESEEWMQEDELEIIVDKQNHRIGIVKGRLLIRNYPAGLGGELTPEGEFTITEKVRNPNGRDDGEFGSRGMTLSDTLYAIHGTNQPDSVGKDQSLGCIRMLAADLEELYDMVPLGTKVTISQNVLPEELVIPNQRFSLPAQSDETNPNKVYQWL